MTALRLLCFLASMNAALAGINEPLDALKRKFGDARANTYRPDLYPTSFDFRQGSIKISVTPFAKVAKKIDVFFEDAPADSVETLLERYSGCSGWNQIPTSDPAFAKHFSSFSTEAGNSFYSCDGVLALVQRDVGFGKLVLWIQTRDYPELLATYRKSKKHG